jgi:inhibitor of KinA
LPGITEIIPAYATLLVEWDPAVTRCETVIRALSRLDPPDGGAGVARHFRVPVLYGGAAGPDLEEAARALGLTADSLAGRHQAGCYRIFCLGFSPGFPLAGPLPEELTLPRRGSPRTRVPPGSVGIAGRQTGIYPLATPGGWHLIGRTPLRLFNPAAASPVAWKPGDSLSFYQVTEEEFHALEAMRPWPTAEAVAGP